MYDKLLTAWFRLRQNDEGATLVEYGIALALAISLGAGALTLLAGDVSGAMGSAGTALPD